MNFKFIVAMAIFIIVSMFNLVLVDAQTTTAPLTPTTGTTTTTTSPPATSG
ncbi:uncharacterized protein LOC100302478 precursor [Acyrthosiphon pisum]|uniref:Uncharacterized protein n=1 Tax=Acyrthosiphon pisum TaxID=7029 RepID=A0A8R1TF63_ACYPI|nr:uncharacterized protein LOC100302478 precursor [Acyrthosiphon pisum]|eukprot:NP_001156803.1 uncharacterized protein LOC100302478 precursor [Acyrthosiphon pisum]